MVGHGGARRRRGRTLHSDLVLVGQQREVWKFDRRETQGRDAEARRVGKLRRKRDEFLRLAGSAFITACINRRFGVRLSDSQNGFRAIRRDVGLAWPLVRP